MRRKDREIIDINEILNVISKCKVLRLGMIDNNKPYIVPLNFGYSYENETLEFYFHSALEGRKINILKENPYVCFEIDNNHSLIEGSIACTYGYRYESVMGEGYIEFIENENDKKNYMSMIMQHQTNKTFKITNDNINRVCIYKLRVNSFSAKSRK